MLDALQTRFDITKFVRVLDFREDNSLKPGAGKCRQISGKPLARWMIQSDVQARMTRIRQNPPDCGSRGRLLACRDRIFKIKNYDIRRTHQRLFRAASVIARREKHAADWPFPEG
jgi:hypothetical protein